MKKYMMTLAAVFCCALVSTLFTSCSKDDDSPADKGTPTYTFKLKIKAGNGADDQQDVVKTVVTIPGNNGVPETHVFSEYAEDMELKSGNFNELPATCTITIDESLLPDVDIAQKEKYSVGLYYKLEVTSTDANGGVLDYKGTEEDPSMTVSADNLSKLYPKTITLKFSVDKNGRISL